MNESPMGDSEAPWRAYCVPYRGPFWVDIFLRVVLARHSDPRWAQSMVEPFTFELCPTTRWFAWPGHSRIPTRCGACCPRPKALCPPIQRALFLATFRGFDVRVVPLMRYRTQVFVTPLSYNKKIVYPPMVFATILMLLCYICYWSRVK